MDNLFDIQGKTALVTGGVNGMGRMIAEGLLQAGAHVYVTTRKPEAAETARQEMTELGQCTVLTGDLTDMKAAVELADEIKSRETALHILINNAGRTWGAPLESFPDEAWPSVMAVNVQGPFTLLRELLPALRTAASSGDPARVINIGSLAGSAVEPLPAYSYAASKAAIHHLSKVLASELSPDITVNALVPGYFPTKMTAHIRRAEDEYTKLLERVPLRRLGQAEDIIGACVYLCSRAGSYVTGTELHVDGGMQCR